MTYENIKLSGKELQAGWTRTIDPFLKPLVEALALKYPQWTFESLYSTTNHSDKTEEAGRFKIIDKREELGVISKDWAKNGYRFQIDNHRINNMRERGSGMKTIHLDKAIKHVGKFFSKKNVSEKLNEARQLAEQGLGNVASSKNWKLREVWNNDEASEALQKYLLSVFPDALTMLDPKIINKLEDFPTRVTEKLEVDSMVKELRLGNMYLVLLDGMDYAIQKGNDAPTIKASEQLPDYMRRAVGLLKLVEDNQVIHGVGYRANANTFMVINKEEV
jgi:Cdc6-like AAA superfamily ATPase